MFSPERDDRVITRFQKMRLVGHPHIDRQILEIFYKYAGNSEQLERLKNLISNERDYHDLVDLVARMSLPYRQLLKELYWNTPVNQSSIYAIKMMVDIDNTTLENSTTGPITYVNRELIPGITSLLRYFSGDGETSVTFLSARPALIERQSIDMINSMLSSKLSFSFSTGTVNPILYYIKGKFNGDLETSYLKMAEEKFSNYLQLKELYPMNRFIFLGDDTQGDPYIAYKLANHSGSNWTAIRRVTGRQFPVEITSHQRIYWHSSYYELAWILLQNGLATREPLVSMLSNEYQSTYQAHLYHQGQVSRDHYYIKMLI